MAHEIDMTTGQAGMAYLAGTKTPWHGLGQTVDPGATPDEWRIAAGLDWDARRARVQYDNAVTGGIAEMNDRDVLYRSDTGAALSVVSKDYRVVQPAEIMEFFGDIAEKNDFAIETVGSLREGRRIWALARIGDLAEIMDDIICPYLMLATSYDGSMATIAQYTSVRVVCNNTLQASLQGESGQRRVSIPHNALFNPTLLKARMGIKLDTWEQFKANAMGLAHRRINDAEADQYLVDLLSPFAPTGQDFSPDKIRNSKAYQRITSLFKGGQMGADQDAVRGTAWGILNATTQYIDHEKGRIDDSRLEQAWFGTGAKIKDAAYDLALKVAA